MVLRSTWAFGFVSPSMGVGAVLMTPIFVVLALIGPSSLPDPFGSTIFAVPATPLLFVSVMIPSIQYGPAFAPEQTAWADARGALKPTIATAIAAAVVKIVRVELVFRIREALLLRIRFRVQQ
jgi:hypothetical protein